MQVLVNTDPNIERLSSSRATVGLWRRRAGCHPDAWWPAPRALQAAANQIVGPAVTSGSQTTVIFGNLCLSGKCHAAGLSGAAPACRGSG